MIPALALTVAHAHTHSLHVHIYIHIVFAMYRSLTSHTYPQHLDSRHEQQMVGKRSWLTPCPDDTNPGTTPRNVKPARGWLQPDPEGCAPHACLKAWQPRASKDWLRPPASPTPVLARRSHRRSWMQCPEVTSHRSQVTGHGTNPGKVVGQPVKRTASMGLDILAHLKGHAEGGGALDKYAQTGVDPNRLKKVLKEGACSCTRRCSEGLDFETLSQACVTFHHMGKEDQEFLIHTMYTTTGAADGPGSTTQSRWLAGRTQWSLCGHQVCVAAFTKLLGIGTHRLYKAVRGTLDMRKSIPGAPEQCRQAAQTDICEGFFQDLYCSAAEPLPNEFHTIDGVDDHISSHPAGISDDEQDPSSPDNNMLDWNPDRPTHEIVTECAGRPDLVGLVRREIPFGRLTDLYWQFLAYCDSLGIQATDDGPNAPSFATFRRAWVDKWSKVLRSKAPSSHSCCQTCFELHEKIYGTWSKPCEKFMWARAWRQHLQDQYHDRMIYWALRFESRRPQADVLVIIIDSMDKAKTVWPKYPYNKKPHELEATQVPRPRSQVTAAIAHGWCTDIFLADDSVFHGASAFIEVLVRVLTHVEAIAEQHGRELPRHIVLQADNTVAQCKNAEVLTFLAHIVGKGKFSTATLNFLMVGHTHEDVDQLFGLICASVLRRFCWETLDDLIGFLEAHIGPHIAQKQEECWITQLCAVRDFNTWLAPHGVHPWNALRTRDGIEAPHSFTFKHRQDLTKSELDEFRSQVNGAARHAGYGDRNSSQSDVFCCVKTYMRDRHLQQAPVLIMPEDRCSWVQNLAPTTCLAAPISDERAAKLLKLATIFEKESYGFHRAAVEIRRLVERPPLELPPPGWLASPPRAPALVQVTGNPYFAHLPETSWNLLVTFHRRLGQAQ